MSTGKPDWSPTLDTTDLDNILSHTGQLWEELRNQSLFITGGTGFFGHWLLESLLWANDHLNLDVKAVLLSRNPVAFANKFPELAHHPAVSWIQGDVKTFEFPSGDFPYLIHAASEGDFTLPKENPLLVFDTIVSGTRHILEFARTHNTEKLLFTSSGAVYGRQPAEITHIPEDYVGAPDVMNPLSAYGEGKRAAEMLCNIYSHQFGFETKIARCFAFVGPYLPLNANYAIGNFIRDALNGGPIVIKGDGTPYRSYLYAADLAIWLWTIFLVGQGCHPYNVGSRIALTIKELADSVIQLSKRRLDVQISMEHTPGTLPDRYVPDIRRAQVELGLEPWRALSKAILRTISWHKPDINLKDRSR
jgi:nucleoside-diphosphate-sugar epimerase